MSVVETPFKRVVNSGARLFIQKAMKYNRSRKLKQVETGEKIARNSTKETFTGSFKGTEKSLQNKCLRNTAKNTTKTTVKSANKFTAKTTATTSTVKLDHCLCERR